MSLIKCKECGKEVSSEAEVCPHCGVKVASKSSIGCGPIIGIALLIGFIALIFGGGNSSNTSGSNSTPQPTTAGTRDDSKNFISIFGEPDRIISTEYDDPRPPIVTKLLLYKKQNVQVAFIADAPVNSPPPYDAWKLLGFQDGKTKQPISNDELQRRMGKRIM